MKVGTTREKLLAAQVVAQSCSDDSYHSKVNLSNFFWFMVPDVNNQRPT